LLSAGTEGFPIVLAMRGRRPDPADLEERSSDAPGPRLSLFASVANVDGDAPGAGQIEASPLPAWIRERGPTFDAPIGADEGSAEPSSVFTIEEFAAILRVSPRTVRRRIKAGLIGRIPGGRAVRIPRSERERLLTASCP
jgi:excisionase family DNA binding protein